jgi:hypothetical protein
VSSPIWDFWPEIFFSPKLLSCLFRAPSLTRDSVCHVSVFVIEVCNSQSLFTTNIYIKLKMYIVLHLQYNKIFTIYTGLVQSMLCTADYALLTRNLVYHGSHSTWTVVHMTAAKFDTGIALLYVINIPTDSAQNGVHTQLAVRNWECSRCVLIQLPVLLRSYLKEKCSGSGLENRNYVRRDQLCWSLNTLCPQKLAPTSPTSGGRSVDIVRSWSKANLLVISYFICFSQNGYGYRMLVYIKHYWNSLRPKTFIWLIF